MARFYLLLLGEMKIIIYIRLWHGLDALEEDGLNVLPCKISGYDFNF